MIASLINMFPRKNTSEKSPCNKACSSNTICNKINSMISTMPASSNNFLNSTTRHASNSPLLRLNSTGETESHLSPAVLNTEMESRVQTTENKIAPSKIPHYASYNLFPKEMSRMPAFGEFTRKPYHDYNSSKPIFTEQGIITEYKNHLKAQNICPECEGIPDFTASVNKSDKLEKSKINLVDISKKVLPEETIDQKDRSTASIVGESTLNDMNSPKASAQLKVDDSDKTKLPVLMNSQSPKLQSCKIDCDTLKKFSNTYFDPVPPGELLSTEKSISPKMDVPICDKPINFKISLNFKSEPQTCKVNNDSVQQSSEKSYEMKSKQQSDSADKQTVQIQFTGKYLVPPSRKKRKLRPSSQKRRRRQRKREPQLSVDENESLISDSNSDNSFTFAIHDISPKSSPDSSLLKSSVESKNLESGGNKIEKKSFSFRVYDISPKSSPDSKPNVKSAPACSPPKSKFFLMCASDSDEESESDDTSSDWGDCSDQSEADGANNENDQLWEEMSGQCLFNPMQFSVSCSIASPPLSEQPLNEVASKSSADYDNLNSVQTELEHSRQTELKDANDRWNQYYHNVSSESKQSKVHFPECKSELASVHQMRVWLFAHKAARKGPWEEYGRDRERFKKRIAEVEKEIRHVLLPSHREKVFQKMCSDS